MISADAGRLVGVGCESSDAMFPDSFSTTRLRAERLTTAHFAELRRMHTDPAVMEHLGGPMSEEASKAYLSANLRHWDEHGFGLWIVYERRGWEPIGRALLRYVLVDTVDEIELGYALYPDHWGKGLATEIAGQCLQFAFRKLGAASVVALTSPANRASQHVLEKVGLTCHGDVSRDGRPCLLFRSVLHLPRP